MDLRFTEREWLLIDFWISITGMGLILMGQPFGTPRHWIISGLVAGWWLIVWGAFKDSLEDAPSSTPSGNDLLVFLSVAGMYFVLLINSKSFVAVLLVLSWYLITTVFVCCRAVDYSVLQSIRMRIIPTKNQKPESRNKIGEL